MHKKIMGNTINNQENDILKQKVNELLIINNKLQQQIEILQNDNVNMIRNGISTGKTTDLDIQIDKLMKLNVSLKQRCEILSKENLDLKEKYHNNNMKYNELFIEHHKILSNTEKKFKITDYPEITYICNNNLVKSDLISINLSDCKYDEITKKYEESLDNKSKVVTNYNELFTELQTDYKKLENNHKELSKKYKESCLKNKKYINDLNTNIKKYNDLVDKYEELNTLNSNNDSRALKYKTQLKTAVDKIKILRDSINELHNNIHESEEKMNNIINAPLSKMNYDYKELIIPQILKVNNNQIDMLINQDLSFMKYNTESFVKNEYIGIVKYNLESLNVDDNLSIINNNLDSIYSIPLSYNNSKVESFIQNDNFGIFTSSNSIIMKKKELSLKTFTTNSIQNNEISVISSTILSSTINDKSTYQEQNMTDIILTPLILTNNSEFISLLKDEKLIKTSKLVNSCINQDLSLIQYDSKPFTYKKSISINNYKELNLISTNSNEYNENEIVNYIQEKPLLTTSSIITNIEMKNEMKTTNYSSKLLFNPKIEDIYPKQKPFLLHGEQIDLILIRDEETINKKKDMPIFMEILNLTSSIGDLNVRVNKHMKIINSLQNENELLKAQNEELLKKIKN